MITSQKSYQKAWKYSQIPPKSDISRMKHSCCWDGWVGLDLGYLLLIRGNGRLVGQTGRKNTYTPHHHEGEVGRQQVLRWKYKPNERSAVITHFRVLFGFGTAERKYIGHDLVTKQNGDGVPRRTKPTQLKTNIAYEFVLAVNPNQVLM